MIDNQMSDKVCRLEEGHRNLSERVMEVERVQSGLVEAVEGVKRSLDRLHDNVSSLGKAIILSVWVAMVMGGVKLFM